jgi:hypothetical protein
VPDNDTTDETPVRKPFAQALQEMRKGGLHTEMSDELAALVRKVMQTGKKGTIKLTLTVARLSDGVTVAIDDKVEVKLPRFDTDATLYWPDSDGNLYRKAGNLEIGYKLDRPDNVKRAAIEDIAGRLDHRFAERTFIGIPR